MKYKYIKFFFTLLLISSLSSFLRAQGDVDQLCGPKSLFAILRYTGQQVSFDEVCSMTKYNPVSGTNMYNIYEAALFFNLDTSPMNLSYNNLKNLKKLCIAHIDGNHFGVILGCDNKYVIFQDYPANPYKISKNEFVQRWDGNVLVFSDKQKDNILSSYSNDKGPKIEFWQDSFDFGDKSDDDIISHEFIFENTGSDTLKIFYARTTCSCTASILSKKIIPPGEFGSIQVELNPKQKNAGFTEERVIVASNDVINPQQIISISANLVKRMAITPEQLWIRNSIREKNSIKKVYLQGQAINKNIIKSILTPKYVTYRILPMEEYSVSALPIEFNILPEYQISVNSNIVIKLNSTQVPEIILPIKGDNDDTLAFPSRLFINNHQSKNEITQQIQLQTSKPLLDIISSDSTLVCTSFMQHNDNSYLVDITIHVPNGVNKISEMISVFSTMNELILEIPVYVKN